MQICPAIRKLFSAISRALSSVFSISARALASEAPARPNRHNPIVRLDHVSRAAQHKRRRRVADDQQRLQMPQHPVRPPVLGQLHGTASQVSRVLFQLGLEAPEERERIRGRSRKPRQHLVLIQPPDLLRRVLHHARAQRHLPVRGHHHRVAPPHAQHRRRPHPPRLALFIAAQIQRMSARPSNLVLHRVIRNVVKSRFHEQLPVYRLPGLNLVYSNPCTRSRPTRAGCSVSSSSRSPPPSVTLWRRSTLACARTPSPCSPSPATTSRTRSPSASPLSPYSSNASPPPTRRPSAISAPASSPPSSTRSPSSSSLHGSRSPPSIALSRRSPSSRAS